MLLGAEKRAKTGDQKYLNSRCKKEDIETDNWNDKKRQNDE